MAKDSEKPKSWWHTLPGVLTALGGLIGAIGGLILVGHQVGWIGGEKHDQISIGSDTTVFQKPTTPDSQPPFQSKSSIPVIDDKQLDTAAISVHEEKKQYIGKPYKGKFLNAFVESCSGEGNVISLAIRVKNVSDKEIYIAFDVRDNPVAIANNKAATWISPTNVYGVPRGLPHLANEYYLREKNKYVRLGIEGETVLVISFQSRNHEVDKGATYNFSSHVAYYNDGDFFSESVGISGIYINSE